MAGNSGEQLENGDLGPEPQEDASCGQPKGAQEQIFPQRRSNRTAALREPEWRPEGSLCPASWPEGMASW